MKKATFDVERSTEGRGASIHPSAVVHSSAILGSDVEIGPFCLVGEHVEIGARTKLLSNVVVNGYTTIGSDTRIFPFTTIGLPSQDRKSRGEISFTKIGDRTTIREFCSVHRATGEGETTLIGNDCLLLAYVHIAHNCVIGDHVTMSNLAQLAGHVIIEPHANVGGATGVHQFARIGAYSMIGGMTRLGRDVPPYFLVEGNPAVVRGLNSVGLRRAEFPSETVAELKDCYKLIYRSGKNLSQAIEEMRKIVATAEGRHLIDFVEAEAQRGILK